MKRVRFLLAVVLAVALLQTGGCERYAPSDDVNGLFGRNDLSIVMKVGEGGYEMEPVCEDDSGEYCLKIDVSEEFSLRGEAEITPGRSYRLVCTLKNVSADPVINYSFWKKPVTSLRHFTFNGEDTNPPASLTQEQLGEYKTFEEVFETMEGEDSIQITLHCNEGVFYLKEISIEELTD